MIDMVGAIIGAAVYAVLVGVLIGFSPVGRAGWRVRTRPCFMPKCDRRMARAPLPP
jgi:hypothetical protein